jgi:ribose 5-phosphate isomerase A
MTTADEMKRAAAQAAVAYVPDDSVVGVGTGSTVNYFIDALARIKGRIEGAVSSSKASSERLKGHGIRVFDLNSVDEVPIYVDGADEITRHMHMIKGGGGALTGEKIAGVARKFVSADAAKLKDVLELFRCRSSGIPWPAAWLAGRWSSWAGILGCVKGL